MKKTIAIVGAVLLMAAGGKLATHGRFGAAFGGAPVTGQPGQVPLVVNAPGALMPYGQTQFVFDGGPLSVPPVQIFPLLAPSVHFASGGEASALVGFDGGSVPGLMRHELGSAVFTTMPNFLTLNANYTNAPLCKCGVASSQAVVQTCTSQLDAGVGGPAGDGGPVTTVVMNTADKDGGVFWYDCWGY